MGEETTGATPLYVFYGSNTGTGEGFAGRVASDVAAHGTLSVHLPSKTLPIQNDPPTDMYRQASELPCRLSTSRPPTSYQMGPSSSSQCHTKSNPQTTPRSSSGGFRASLRTYISSRVCSTQSSDEGTLTRVCPRSWPRCSKRTTRSCCCPGERGMREVLSSGF